MRALAAFVVFAAAPLAGCGNGEKPADPVRPVITVVVAPGAAATRDVYSGEVRSRVETDLAFRVGGKIAARLVDAGARVKAGQPLARLDPEDARLAADAARAQIASAEADLALARSELERARDLLARQFISRSGFEAKEAAFKAAAARAEQARAQAAVSVNQQGYTTLVADGDGLVLTVSAEPGQVVAAGQPVLRLARDGPMEVVISVPEGQVSRFRAGQPVGLTLWAQPDSVFPGQVREVAGGADPVTRTFAVRVAAPRHPEGMRVGMTASVVAAPEKNEAVMVVPLTALSKEGNEAAVWIVDPKTSRVQKRPVKVGQYREDGATILSGLAAGEIVVAAGVHKLRPDQPVRLSGTPSPVAPAASR
jgi:RND family efflux transporter MFP subunit